MKIKFELNYRLKLKFKLYKCSIDRIYWNFRTRCRQPEGSAVRDQHNGSEKGGHDLAVGKQKLFFNWIQGRTLLTFN